MGLPEDVADRLLGEVVQGRFAVESLLPPERVWLDAPFDR